MSPLEVLHLLTFPLIGAAIGWFTNFLAIKMLFHPREPIGPPGTRLQGLLPRRRMDLADKIGETVAVEILSAGELDLITSFFFCYKKGVVGSIDQAVG